MQIVKKKKKKKKTELTDSCSAHAHIITMLLSCHFLNSSLESILEYELIMIIGVQRTLPVYSRMTLDHVWHGEVHDVVSPGEFEDDVGSQQVVALEERRRKALVVLVLEEPCDQVLGDVDVARLGRVHSRPDGSTTGQS